MRRRIIFHMQIVGTSNLALHVSIKSCLLFSLALCVRLPIQTENEAAYNFL